MSWVGGGASIEEMDVTGDSERFQVEQLKLVGEVKPVGVLVGGGSFYRRMRGDQGQSKKGRGATARRK